MNLGPPLSSWLQMLGVLALEVALVVACAAAAARLVGLSCSSRSSHASIWQRTIWQICWLGLAILTVAEITGLGRGAVAIVWSRFHPHASSVGIAILPPEWKTTGEIGRPLAKSRMVEIESPPWTESASIAAHSPIRPKAQVQSTEPSGNSWPAMIWLSLSGILLTRWMMLRVSFLWFRWRYLKPAPSLIRNEVIELANRIGLTRMVRVLQSIRLASPIAFGVFRPAVGLPRNFGRKHPTSRRQVMLAHELAHLQSHDPEWYLLADIVLALLWWHPMAWWAQCRLHDASEAAADEASLIINGGPVVLAECLVELGGQLIHEAAPGGLGMAGYGLRSNLAQRVRLLLKINGGNWQPPSQWRIRIVKILGTFALLTALLTCAAWIQPGISNIQGSTSSVLTIAWQKSPLASLLNSAIGTENPFILLARAPRGSSSVVPPISGKAPRVPAQPAAKQSQTQSSVIIPNDVPATDRILEVRAGFPPIASGIAFGLDDSFVNYFGGSGVVAVESAAGHSNPLPDPIDSVDGIGVSIGPKHESSGGAITDRGDIFQPTPGGGDKVAIPGEPSASAHLALQADQEPSKPQSKGAPESPSFPNSRTNNPVEPVNGPQQVILNEAMRREEIAAVLKINSSRAGAAYKKGDLASAVKLYDEVLSLGREIGGIGVEVQENEARTGLIAAHLELAYRAQERGDFGAARAEADAILRFDPENAKAIKFKEFNQQVTEANRSRLPSPEVKARIFAYRERQSRIEQMVRDAQALFDAGALDEAKSKFAQAIELDPSNDTAFYYLRLIQEKHADQLARQRELLSGKRILEVGEAWTKQTPANAPPSNPATNAPVPLLPVNPKAGTGAVQPKDNIDPVARRTPADPNKAASDHPSATPPAGPAGGASADLQTAVIRVDLSALYRELESAGGMDNGALASTPHEQLGTRIQSLWRNYFDKIGAQYGFHGMAPQLLLQTLAGVALVRGTPDETSLAEKLAVEKFRVMSGAQAGPPSSRTGSAQTVKPDDSILTRTYRLDADAVGRSLENTYYPGAVIRNVPDRNDPERPAVMNEMLRGFLAAAGADLNPGSPYAARVLFNSLNGMLMVRATARDLDIVQDAVEVLNTAPALIKIEAREFELPIEQLMNLKLAFSVSRGTEAGAKSDAPNQMLAFLSAEKTGEVIQSLEQSGITPIDFTPVVTPGGTPASVTYADGTSIDITPSATAGNSGIDTSAILDGRSSHFVVRNGYTTAIGLQTNPKAKLHFITLTIIDSQGNPLNVPPPAPVK